MSEAIDYGADNAPAAEDNILAQIDVTALELMRANLVLVSAREALETAEKRVKDLVTRVLPDLMETARQTQLVTTSGLKITLKDVVRASISEERKAVAFPYLREHNLGAIIKNAVVIPFEAGKDAAADALVKQLAETYPQAERVSSVHAGTLSAQVRELLEEGKIDQEGLEILGAAVWKEATVRPK